MVDLLTDVNIFNREQEIFITGLPLKKLFMKTIIFCFAFVFGGTSLIAQKESSIIKSDTELVNQKLVHIQSTVKNLEATLNEAKTLMTKLQKKKM